jgi:hypothetical protein
MTNVQYVEPSTQTTEVSTSTMNVERSYVN